ncbi:multidrug efflux RND transporter permease subunit MdtC [Xenorhabdus nematophila]|uniref:Multidrug resistance protein MdtC n=1 Tax=Xenorhabdus nematophila (strain ATCC 19061 / DSM 3370 / CCUG 14189 / LMG 1036 / NCIMB 9965 / AN6) TaxID=406817 RepID=D3VI97_XENNA|nr:multidrug efflux RND transporter permease subunit MdtC [Xenorhabdus nematophila]CBJ90737.1 multidrug transport protein, outer membrane (RND family) [Xenorhabdus nematophila ATCC 19061]CEE90110.1 multidrug transport protein, outer membrane (RND family) [Xenorhabdus nematophila str. Anatoliense]CEE93133.1 multidrug transport protein, outer membrane (RND family) [Xenorhabdus nematophila str. Anatoliense]CEK23574.1 multidrug transport protein, outer membrane (RND family) [Xenorhabdus nematophila
MKFFALFIQRPVATTLLSLAITLCGALSFVLLPVSPLPQVDFPVITVQASMPGASPETMASSVTTPLERALGRIAGVKEMSSASSLGTSFIYLEFDLNRDINGAARDVQAAINAAQSLLPSGMPSKPQYYKANLSDAPIMLLTLTSDNYSEGQLYDLASTRMAQKLSQIEGVSQVSVSGSSLPAIRVELNPNALFNQGVSLNDVGDAISNANVRRPTGYVDSDTQSWQLHTNDELKTADSYRSIIVHYNNDAPVRLQDVATVKNSVEDIRAAGMSGNKSAIAIIIRREAGANIIATVQRIREQLPILQELLPASIHLNIAQDRSPTIRASLQEVEQALAIAVALVILVVFLFLRSGRATLIPAIAVPVSLIGTFTAMYLCGFSLNNLSLMALTIATGFVVDDAIVVLENISRHLDAGMKPMQAAFKGVREVGFTVLAMSLSLIAVFIPLVLIDELLGRLFRDFAVTLATAIGISLLVSLTLTPMMCAHLLKSSPIKAQKQKRGFGKILLKVQQNYGRSLKWILNHTRWVLLTLVGIIALNIWLYISIPKTFFPQQDTGKMLGFIVADQSISFQAMREKVKRFMQIVDADPTVDNVVGFTGGDSINTGFMFVSLKPLEERTESIQQVITRLRGQLTNEAGARLYLIPVQDLRSGGRGAKSTYQFSLLSDDFSELRKWSPVIKRALEKQPQLVDVNSDEDEDAKGAEIAITYDRDIMARLGINVSDANNLLHNAFGQRQISTIYQPLNQYKVVMEVAPQYNQDPSALEKMFVINAKGERIPLSYFARWYPSNAPLDVYHQGLSASSTIAFDVAPGYTLSDAIGAIERTMTELSVPSAVRSSFSGTAQDFQDSERSQLLVILAAIVTVYLVLGVLYESYIHPLTILSTLPSAGVGALLALELFNTPFSLIAMIGIMLLVGIVKKNAIIMVDFALEAQRSGKLSAQEAIFQASLLRFRPIMMTTLSALFGALPLVMSNGDGAELRFPLGITIVGGLVMSQLLTLYTTPVVYLFFDKLREKRLRRRAAKIQLTKSS